jgi:hypothetical protein
MEQTDMDMECYDEEDLPHVDDLAHVAVIAAEEMRQLEKIEAAAARAKEFRQMRLESQQRGVKAADAPQKT